VRQGEIWTAQGPEGPIQIRFTDRNEFGVMDHWVDLGGGRVVYVPLRIVANGSGAEVLLTLFRQPEMSDAKFAQDQDWGETRPAGAESAGGTLAELRVSISERA
jgi:hypothetical protein